MWSEWDWQAWAEQILPKIDLKSIDEVLKKRLLNIIVARLKDIRDVLETKDVLTRSVKVGGLGLDETMADRIIKLIGEAAKQSASQPPEAVKPKPEIPKPVIKPEELQAAIRASAEVTKQRLSSQKLSSPNRLDVSHELAPPPPALKRQSAFIRPAAVPAATSAPAPARKMPVADPFGQSVALSRGLKTLKLPPN